MSMSSFRVKVIQRLRLKLRRFDTKYREGAYGVKSIGILRIYVCICTLPERLHIGR